jgi:hypothetical protein
MNEELDQNSPADFAFDNSHGANDQEEVLDIIVDEDVWGSSAPSNPNSSDSKKGQKKPIQPNAPV